MAAFVFRTDPIILLFCQSAPVTDSQVHYTLTSHHFLSRLKPTCSTRAPRWLTSIGMMKLYKPGYSHISLFDHPCKTV
jgi:hypothetical protein